MPEFCERCGAEVWGQEWERPVKDETQYWMILWHCPNCNNDGASCVRESPVSVESQNEDVGRGESTRDDDHPLG